MNVTPRRRETSRQLSLVDIYAVKGPVPPALAASDAPL